MGMGMTVTAVIGSDVMTDTVVIAGMGTAFTVVLQ